MSKHGQKRAPPEGGALPHAEMAGGQAIGFNEADFLLDWCDDRTAHGFRKKCLMGLLVLSTLTTGYVHSAIHMSGSDLTMHHCHHGFEQKPGGQFWVSEGMASGRPPAGLRPASGRPGRSRRTAWSRMDWYE